MVYYIKKGGQGLMIEIKSKDTGKTVETICNEEDFKIDSLYIYSKDEFGCGITWNRDYFVAIKQVKI